MAARARTDVKPRGHVRAHRRRKPSGGYTHVREHQRRGGGTLALAGAAVGAVVLGVPAGAVAAGLVVVLPMYAAARYPDETRRLTSAVRQAAEQATPLLRSARRAAVAHGREALARRERRHRFEREVIEPLKPLAEHPELVARALEANTPEEWDAAISYGQQAAAAVRRAGRGRELRALLWKVSRHLRKAHRRLQVEGRYAGAFYKRLWQAPARHWVPAGRSVWSHADLPWAPQRGRRGKQPRDLLADAAALKTLSMVAHGKVGRETTDALDGLFDELWQFFEQHQGREPSMAAQP